MYTFARTIHWEDRPSDLFEYAEYNVYEGEKKIAVAHLDCLGKGIDIRMKSWDYMKALDIVGAWASCDDRPGNLTKHTEHFHFIVGHRVVQSFYA